MTRTLIAIILMLLTSSAFAIDPLGFSDQAEEQRFQHLTAQLRCLQCQNQNLADSDADLAKDMRAQVFALMRAQKSDAEIISHMRDRFGDFVLYTPPVSAQNSPLWIIPAAALLLGLAALYWQFRPRAAGASTAPPNNPEDW